MKILKNLIEDGEYTYKFYNISAVTYHRQLNWCQIKIQTNCFYSIFKYANYYMCIICIFMNINKYVKNKGKSLKT